MISLLKFSCSLLALISLGNNFEAHAQQVENLEIAVQELDARDIERLSIAKTKLGQFQTPSEVLLNHEFVIIMGPATNLAPLANFGALRTRFKTSPVETSCSASQVGPQVLLTAAHCVESGLFKIESNRQSIIAASCDSFKSYKDKLSISMAEISSDNSSEDWALCELTRENLLSSYETISTKIEQVPVSGKLIIVSGFGCTRFSGPQTGKLVVAKAVVTKNLRKGALARNTFQISTRPETAHQSQVLLCPGDSGGPAFIQTGPSLDDRVIIGVNAETQSVKNVSTFSATGTSAAKKFFHEWADRKSQSICGINRTYRCRGL